jgi:hypothetical protein
MLPKRPRSLTALTPRARRKRSNAQEEQCEQACENQQLMRNLVQSHSITTEHAWRRRWAEWEKVIASELAEMKAKNALTQADHSSALDQILIGTTWVFTCKYATDPGTGKHRLQSKAHPAARDDQQQAADINDNHRASPTADLDMLRVFTAIVAVHSRTNYLATRPLFCVS